MLTPPPPPTTPTSIAIAHLFKKKIKFGLRSNSVIIDHTSGSNVSSQLADEACRCCTCKKYFFYLFKIKFQKILQNHNVLPKVNQHFLSSLVALLIRGLFIWDQDVIEQIPQWYVVSSTNKRGFFDLFLQKLRCGQCQIQ